MNAETTMDGDQAAKDIGMELDWIEDLYQAFCAPVDTKEDGGMRFLADEEPATAMLGEDEATWSTVATGDATTWSTEEAKMGEDSNTMWPNLDEINSMLADGMTPDAIASDEWMSDNDNEMPTLDDIKDMHAKICDGIKTFHTEATTWNKAGEDEKKKMEDGWTSDITTFFEDLLQDGASALVAGAALATSVTLLAF